MKNQVKKIVFVLTILMVVPMPAQAGLLGRFFNFITWGMFKSENIENIQVNPPTVSESSDGNRDLEAGASTSEPPSPNISLWQRFKGWFGWGKQSSQPTAPRPSVVGRPVTSTSQQQRIEKHTFERMKEIISKEQSVVIDEESLTALSSDQKIELFVLAGQYTNVIRTHRIFSNLPNSERENIPLDTWKEIKTRLEALSKSLTSLEQTFYEYLQTEIDTIIKNHQRLNELRKQREENSIQEEERKLMNILINEETPQDDENSAYNYVIDVIAKSNVAVDLDFEKKFLALDQRGMHAALGKMIREGKFNFAYIYAEKILNRGIAFDSWDELVQLLNNSHIIISQEKSEERNKLKALLGGDPLYNTVIKLIKEEMTHPDIKLLEKRLFLLVDEKHVEDAFRKIIATSNFRLAQQFGEKIKDQRPEFNIDWKSLFEQSHQMSTGQHPLILSPEHAKEKNAFESFLKERLIIKIFNSVFDTSLEAEFPETLNKLLTSLESKEQLRILQAVSETISQNDEQLYENDNGLQKSIHIYEKILAISQQSKSGVALEGEDETGSLRTIFSQQHNDGDDATSVSESGPGSLARGSSGAQLLRNDVNEQGVQLQTHESIHEQVAKKIDVLSASDPAYFKTLFYQCDALTKQETLILIISKGRYVLAKELIEIIKSEEIGIDWEFIKTAAKARFGNDSELSDCRELLKAIEDIQKQKLIEEAALAQMPNEGRGVCEPISLDSTPEVQPNNLVVENIIKKLTSTHEGPANEIQGAMEVCKLLNNQQFTPSQLYRILLKAFEEKKGAIIKKLVSKMASQGIMSETNARKVKALMNYYFPKFGELELTINIEQGLLEDLSSDIYKEHFEKLFLDALRENKVEQAFHLVDDKFTFPQPRDVNDQMKDNLHNYLLKNQYPSVRVKGTVALWAVENDILTPELCNNVGLKRTIVDVVAGWESGNPILFEQFRQKNILSRDQIKPKVNDEQTSLTQSSTFRELYFNAIGAALGRSLHLSEPAVLKCALQEKNYFLANKILVTQNGFGVVCANKSLKDFQQDIAQLIKDNQSDVLKLYLTRRDYWESNYELLQKIQNEPIVTYASPLHFAIETKKFECVEVLARLPYVNLLGGIDDIQPGIIYQLLNKQGDKSDDDKKIITILLGSLPKKLNKSELIRRIKTSVHNPEEISSYLDAIAHGKGKYSDETPDLVSEMRSRVLVEPDSLLTTKLKAAAAMALSL